MIAGVATGAIAHGALVAEEMGLPFIYVRSSKKGDTITLDKINTEVGNKFDKKNIFNKKIDELNQETETLIDEIEKWQT